MSPDHLTDNDLELSALYALGALDAAESAALEARVRRGEPALAAEIQSMKAVAALLGRTAAAEAPGALRQRLLERFRAERASVLIRAGEGEWQDGIVAGMRSKRLFLDEVAGRLTSLARMNPGASYPAHRHAGTEELYLLDGTLMVDGQVLGVGDFCCAPAGSSHLQARSDRGCTFILTASTRDELIPEPVAPSSGLVFVRASAGGWRDSTTPGVSTRLIFKDAARGTRTMLVRMTPGTRLPRHRHATAEQFYMLEGDGQVGGALLSSGDFYAAPEGSTHEGSSTEGGCTFLLIGSRLEAVS